jgi:hypothetical protein
MARVAAIAGTVGAFFVGGSLFMLGGPGPELMAEGPPAESHAFVTECMEAELLWKEGTIGFRLSATPDQRSAARGKCSAAYASGNPTPAMLDVRSGKLTVRSGGDSSFDREEELASAPF